MVLQLLHIKMFFITLSEKLSEEGEIFNLLSTFHFNQRDEDKLATINYSISSQF